LKYHFFSLRIFRNPDKVLKRSLAIELLTIPEKRELDSRKDLIHFTQLIELNKIEYI